MTNKKTIEPRNLLALKPRRTVEWEEGENGRVVILFPKFRNKFLVAWLLPMLSKKNFRIKLDAYGSFLWRLFDGSTSVEEMGARMEREFGRDAEPVFDRIGKFLRKLEKEKFIALEN
ncbi:MAG TPA: PqqD family protein [Bacteroidota bacterium]|nr:MAG: hypothetical protein A2X66_06550 [Ignavibacteria bacterium GWA2_54_16]HLE33401.1 PqqD family protein [Bacteroidota bacterium]